MSKLGFKAGGDHCCAVGCNHKRGTHSCSFLSFPGDKEWFEIWRRAVNRLEVDENGRQSNKLWTPKPFHRLCSCHFTKAPNPRRRLIGWNHVKPDLTLGSKPNKPRPTSKARNRALPLSEKFNVKTETVTACDQHDLVLLEPGQISNEECSSPVATQDTPNEQIDDHDYLRTERRGRFVEEFDRLCDTFPEMQDFIHEFRQAQDSAELLDRILEKGLVLCLAAVKHSPSLFQYYTGLPNFQVFEALLHYLKDKATDMQYVSTAGQTHNADVFASKPGPKRCLPLEEELFSTLVRLRLGLPSKHCSRLFGISESTYSVIFNTWVTLLAKELEKICCMPTTEKTLEQRAGCFDRFPNTRIVLDCTELFAQTPSTLENHKQVHSFYKHHSTVKFLVGMSPSGAITFISDMWGGRASDKKITQESDVLLDALDAGNSVMVDRGFTISEDLPPGVKLLIPPFKNKNTGQFSPEQLKYSESIAVARIHVERAMRAIKENRLLEMEVKLAMINNFENIFKACAYLVNFKKPFLKVK